MLQTHELLDRFELLYPLNTNLSDLRRAYIDKDLSSIFRLIPDTVNGNFDDLRKAVLEQNLYSIFRLVSGTDTVNGNFDDLRKAVLEQNLHSIFRLVSDTDTVNGNFDDLRKAVLEQNLHSIFRLVSDEDLRKLIIEDNTWKLWTVLDRYVETQFVSAFKSFFVNNININHDCFSRGQLQSKLWLIEELKKLNLDLGTVFLCAGWYGTLSVMLFESGIKISKIRNFDIDPTTVDIAEIFNKPWFVDNWKYKSIIYDIMNINYSEHVWQCWSNANNRMSHLIIDKPDTIINTSCEHIENFSKWYDKIPAGKLIILQGNDYFEIKEHVNCSNNLTEFSNKSPMTTVLYEGEIELSKYKRFMKIGYR